MAKSPPYLAALLLALSPLPATAKDALTVLISCTNTTGQTSTGSGVLVSPKGHVLTAKHVAPEGYTCKGAIGGINAQQHPLTPLTEARNFDAMVLKFDHAKSTDHASYCKMSEEMKGRDIRVYGFHALSKNEPPVTDGIISTYTLDEKGMFETTAETAQGKSGGPAFLKDTTALIGIVGGANFNAKGVAVGYMLTPADKLAEMARLIPSEDCAPRTDGYDLEKHEDLLDEKLAKLLSQLQSATSDEANLLRKQLAEIQQQKADLETSYKARGEELRLLRLQLAELDNGQIAAEKLDATQEALSRGDTAQADEVFKEIEEAEPASAKRVAAAAYAQGKIAEDNVQWADAAKHYAKAARLDPTYAHLRSATEFAWRNGDYTSALRFGEDLINAAINEYGQKTAEHAAALNQHAASLHDTGRLEQAEPLYREAIQIDGTTLGKDHPNYAAGLNNLANLLKTTGRYAEAEPLFRETLRIDEITIGKDHPTRATHLNNLAELLRATKRVEEAEPLYREAIRVDQITIGKEHPTHATHLNNLANLLAATRRYGEAEQLYREAIRISETTIGKEHPNYAGGLNNLASLLSTTGRVSEAEPLYREAIRITGNAIGKEHPSYAIRLNNLARLLETTGRDGEAEPLYREANRILEASLGENHPNTKIIRGNLNKLLTKIGKQ